jgi:phosphoglycolate phosphatase
MTLHSLDVFAHDSRRVALFDLDGTLVDSLEGMTMAVNRLLKSLGARPLPMFEVAPLLGHGLIKLANQACHLRGVEPSPDDMDSYMRDYREDPLTGTRLYPGVLSTLTVLVQQGWRLGVCTNKIESVATTILASMGVLGYFDVVCGGDSVAWPKPDPRHIAHALEAAGMSTCPAVLIGDTTVDVGAARAFGIPYIFAAWGYGGVPADVHESSIATSIVDVPALLDRIMKSPDRG